MYRTWMDDLRRGFAQNQLTTGRSPTPQDQAAITTSGLNELYQENDKNKTLNMQQEGLNLQAQGMAQNYGLAQQQLAQNQSQFGAKMAFEKSQTPSPASNVMQAAGTAGQLMTGYGRMKSALNFGDKTTPSQPDMVLHPNQYTSGQADMSTNPIMQTQATQAPEMGTYTGAYGVADETTAFGGAYGAEEGLTAMTAENLAAQGMETGMASELAGMGTAEATAMGMDAAAMAAEMGAGEAIMGASTTMDWNPIGWIGTIVGAVVMGLDAATGGGVSNAVGQAWDSVQSWFDDWL